MKKKRFNEVQILNVLKAYESGISAVDLSRKYGIGESTIYGWHSKYAGMELSELKRLRQLEDENNRLKKMYATLSMDFELMKEALEKKLNQDLSGEKWRDL
jgi:putative transposase